MQVHQALEVGKGELTLVHVAGQRADCGLQTTTDWDRQKKTDALRKAYRRAVQLPLEHLGELWRDYEAFEYGHIGSAVCLLPDRLHA